VHQAVSLGPHPPKDMQFSYAGSEPYRIGAKGDHEPSKTAVDYVLSAPIEMVYFGLHEKIKCVVNP
jgi:hypothetical protein